MVRASRRTQRLDMLCTPTIKESVKAYASACGMSVAGYISELISRDAGRLSREVAAASGIDVVTVRWFDEEVSEGV